MDAFKSKSPDFEKLVSFGFTYDGKQYLYSTKILNDQFELLVNIVSPSGEVNTKLTDLTTGDLYTLHLVEASGGAFVGAVRAEYERVLTEIADKCFYKDVFKSDDAHSVIKYVKDKYGDELEFLWEKFPDDAVLRRKDTGKWYAALLVISKRKLGLDSDDIIYIIDLRIDPEVLPTLIDGKKYFAGYHMNKKNWITICLDGSVPVDEICDLLDKSYNLAH